MRILFLFIFIQSVLLSSCLTDKAFEFIPAPDTSCTHQGQDIISFANDIVPILTTYCTSDYLGDCHSAGNSNGDFTVYSEVFDVVQSGDFEDRLLITMDMPDSDSAGPTELLPCELEKIRVWIEQGAQNN